MASGVAGALFVWLKLRGDDGPSCLGAAMAICLYMGWATAILAIVVDGWPDTAIQSLFLALYVVIPLPVVALGFLSLARPHHRRLVLSLAGAASLPLVLPMMGLSVYWWVETGGCLVLLGFIPAIVFFLEAHGRAIFGKNPWGND